MSAYGGNDVQEKLYNLDQEERLIMAELEEMDTGGGGGGGAASATPSAAAASASAADGPAAALNAILAECERDVRSAKGYIKPGVQPLQIVRVIGGQKAPKSATFLSRPKSTGVDFTVPVTLPDYLAVIKRPIFLNDVRDKCARGDYKSAEEYLTDMSLLAKNTAAFNRGEELSWVVQHARLLLEAAEEAVGRQRKRLTEAEAAVKGSGKHTSGGSGGIKRRRSGGKAASAATSAAAHVESAVPPPPAGAGPVPTSSTGVTAGARLFVLWRDDMTWYAARVVKKISAHRAEVEYDDDRTRQVVDLRVDKWRPMLHAKGRKGGQPAAKRQKSTAAAVAKAAPSTLGAGFVGAVAGLQKADLDEASATWAAGLEDVEARLLEVINSRFDRVERALQRSDAMTRVLLTVNDLADIVAESTGRLQGSIEEVREKLADGRGRTKPGGGVDKDDAIMGSKERNGEEAGKENADAEANLKSIEESRKSAGDAEEKESEVEKELPTVSVAKSVGSGDGESALSEGKSGGKDAAGTGEAATVSGPGGADAYDEKTDKEDDRDEVAGVKSGDAVGSGGKGQGESDVAGDGINDKAGKGDEDRDVDALRGKTEIAKSPDAKDNSDSSDSESESESDSDDGKSNSDKESRRAEGTTSPGKSDAASRAEGNSPDKSDTSAQAKREVDDGVEVDVPDNQPTSQTKRRSHRGSDGETSDAGVQDKTAVAEDEEELEASGTIQASKQDGDEEELEASGKLETGEKGGREGSAEKKSAEKELLNAEKSKLKSLTKKSSSASIESKGRSGDKQATDFEGKERTGDDGDVGEVKLKKSRKESGSDDEEMTDVQNDKEEVANGHETGAVAEGNGRLEPKPQDDATDAMES